MHRRAHRIRTFVMKHVLHRARKKPALERLPPEIRVMIFQEYLQEHQENLDSYYLDIDYWDVDRQTWANGLPYWCEILFKIKTALKVLLMSLWIYLFSPFLAWLPSVAAAWLFTLPLLPFYLTSVVSSPSYTLNMDHTV